MRIVMKHANRSRRLRLLTLAPLVACVSASLAVVPSEAALLRISNVSVYVSAPEEAVAAFPATVTIKNTGTLGQPPGSEATLSVQRGTISNLPAGCKVKHGKTQCRAWKLQPGQTQSFTFTVNPSPAATSVFTAAVVKAAKGEFNVPGDDRGDFDGKRTTMRFAFGLDLTSEPTEVRNGDDTLLSAKVTNSGTPQTITTTIATGNQADPDFALWSECDASEDLTTVTCTSAFGVGEVKTFDVAVVTPATGSSLRSTATATGSVGGTASDSADTSLFEEATAFVPEGQELSSEGEDTQTTFTVPDDSAPGLFLDLNEVELPTGTQCGSHPCHTNAAEALWPNDQTYSGNDPAHPFVWDITYNVEQFCGSGSEPTCYFNPIYYIPSGSTTAVPMPKCSTFTATAPANAPVLDNVDQVCLNFVTWTADSATYQVALLRDIIIPIISGLSRGR